MITSNRTQSLVPSQIREIAEEGMQYDDITPLWFGESAWPSPKIAVEAAQQALHQGDHFYQPNNGKTELRDAICTYSAQRHGRIFNRKNITVTASGMQALALTAQVLVNPGDRVVVLEPGWPNIAQTFSLSGAHIHTETLVVKEGKWFLDLNRFLPALTADTRAVVINSPSNPTGWTISRQQQQVILDHCRKRGIWIVTDDVYARLYRHGDCAPLFLDISDPQDQVISLNSFSKAWSMTGWRLGWINAPEALENQLAMLTEFNIAGPAGFIQAAGVKMLQHGESEVALLNSRVAQAYAMAKAALSAIGPIEFIEPDGAFYCFFRVDGMRNSLKTAQNLMRQSRVGLAPGTAFGAAGEGHLRLCYAQPQGVLETAFEKLAAGLASAVA